MVYTKNGVTAIINFLNNNAGTPPTDIAVGTDNTTANKDDTALLAEITRKKITSTISDTSTITFSVILNSSEGNGNSLKEAGLLNAATSGDLFSRFTHAAITKTNSYELEYAFTIQVAN